MKLSMDIIIGQLEQYQIEQIDGEPSLPQLEGVRMLYPGITDLEPSYLYLGVASDFAHLHVDAERVTLVCCGPLTTGCDVSGCNLYHILNTTEFGRVFNDMEQVFHHYALWEEKLSELVASLAELQKFIDVSDPLFPYPLAIIDYAESTLAMSAGKESDDPVWQDLKTGHIRTSFLLNDSVQGKELAGGRDLVERYSTGSERFILIQPINMNQHTVAFLSAHMPQKGMQRFPRSTQHLLAVLASAVAKRMRTDELYNMSVGMIPGFFIADLISRKVTEPAMIADRAHFLNWKVEQKRRILRIDGEKLRASGRDCKIASERVSEILRHCDCFIYEQGVVVLEHDTTFSGTIQRRYPMLVQWLEENKYCCGVSNPFDSLEQVPGFYDQAVQALHFGQIAAPGDRIYLYSNYSFLHSLALLEERVDLRSMIHPMVAQIFDLYGPNNVMIDTLKAYLRCERNISNAAKNLFIHRNSMVYRIEQLTMKLDCDFSDYNLRAELLYSMDILDYLQKIKQDYGLGKNHEKERNAPTESGGTI